VPRLLLSIFLSRFPTNAYKILGEKPGRKRSFGRTGAESNEILNRTSGNNWQVGFTVPKSGTSVGLF
jgi:hypothetical protein